MLPSTSVTFGTNNVALRPPSGRAPCCSLPRPKGLGYSLSPFQGKRSGYQHPKMAKFQAQLGRLSLIGQSPRLFSVFQAFTFARTDWPYRHPIQKPITNDERVEQHRAEMGEKGEE
jgi:hypothetical protein